MARAKTDKTVQRGGRTSRSSGARMTAPSLPRMTRQSKARKFYKAPRSAFETDDICCDCDPELLEDGNEKWASCSKCEKQQHVDCATPNTGILEAITDPLCNVCKMVRLHQHFAEQRQQFEHLAAMLHRKRAEAQDLCTTVLWKHYCNLPKGRSSDSALEMTEVRYRNGAMVPVHSPPQGWIDEVHARIGKVVEDAGEETAEAILGPASSGNLITDTGHLVYWRELARWMLHAGLYRGNTAELGVLGEILGFTVRGTFWREDWREADSDSATID